MATFDLSYNSDYSSNDRRKLNNSNPFQGEESRVKESSFFQKVAGFLALLGVVFCLITIVIFAKNTNANEGYMGGLNWTNNISNYHPIFMTCGMIVFFVTAAVSYRMFPFGHTINKIIHAVCHTLSLCFVVTGITCMVLSKNYVKYSNTDDYVNNTATVELTPNLYTLHSFIGIGALCLWFQNYALGLIAFACPVLGVELKKWYMPHHIFYVRLTDILKKLSRTLTLTLTLGAVLTGMQQQLTSSNVCQYPVTTIDSNPAKNYHLLPEGCRLGNGFGVLAIATIVCAIFAISDSKTKDD